MPRVRPCSAVISAIGAVALTAMVLSTAAVAAAPTRKTPLDGEWLYVHTAEQATLRPVKGTGASRLTLTRAAERVHALAGPTERKIDYQSAADFVRSWATHGFARRAPNAAIVVHQGKPNQDTLVVKLSQPRLLAGGSISYLARPLSGSRPADLHYFNRRADRSLPARFGATSVYLDDAASGGPVTFFVSWDYAVGGTIRTSGTLTPSRVETSGSYQGFYERSAIHFNPFAGAGYVSATAEPLGDCLPLTMAYGSEGSVTAYAQTGNELGAHVTLKEGANELPVRPGVTCP